MSLLSSFDKKLNQPDLGLLVVRVVFGAVICIFGVSKLLGGSANLASIGGAMAKFGITQAPMFWGLLAALTETLGGLCILLGVFFRPAAALLFFNMMVAVTSVWGAGPNFSSFDGFLNFVQTTAMALAFCAVFLALLFTGPGQYAIQKAGGGGGRSGGGAGKAKD